MSRPEGLTVQSTLDAQIVKVHPWLSDLGRRETRIVLAGGTFAAVLIQIGRIASVTSFMLSTVVSVVGVAMIVATVTWMAREWLRDHRRSQLSLDVHLGRFALELVWHRGDKPAEHARVQLRDIGRVDVREAGYERWHVVAQLAGGTVLEIPMERETREAAQWMAGEIARESREARSREGGPQDVPAELQPLR